MARSDATCEQRPFTLGQSRWLGTPVIALLAAAWILICITAPTSYFSTRGFRHVGNHWLNVAAFAAVIVIDAVAIFVADARRWSKVLMLLPCAWWMFWAVLFFQHHYPITGGFAVLALYCTAAVYLRDDDAV